MQPITLLKNKRIVLAVTGSIAVYKAIDLASKLTQAGAWVDVIMTQAAQQFVTPLAFQAVTGRPVYTSMWQAPENDSDGGLPTHIAHVGLGEGADLLAIIPATANTLAKLAQGIADDLLTVTALAARCPLLIAPAMDGGMYQHAATQHNVQTLVDRGAYLIEPEEGRFASGLVGKGRLPETNTLIGHIRLALGSEGKLNGRRVVITAGGTREPLDPVRYITNHSSGKQGYAIAQAALDAGAQVTLISTVNHLPEPTGAKMVYVDTALALQGQVLTHVGRTDALIMAAAVADFRPADVSAQKIKKKNDDEGIWLELERNPDILMTIKERHRQSKYPRVVVGFAAESENLYENAQGKLERKALDMLIANDITATDAGFAVDTNRIVLFQRDSEPQAFDLMTKAEVGELIVDRLATLLNSR